MNTCIVPLHLGAVEWILEHLVFQDWHGEIEVCCFPQCLCQCCCTTWLKFTSAPVFPEAKSSCPWRNWTFWLLPASLWKMVLFSLLYALKGKAGTERFFHMHGKQSFKNQPCHLTSSQTVKPKTLSFLSPILPKGLAQQRIRCWCLIVVTQP